MKWDPEKKRGGCSYNPSDTHLFIFGHLYRGKKTTLLFFRSQGGHLAPSRRRSIPTMKPRRDSSHVDGPLPDRWFSKVQVLGHINFDRILGHISSTSTCLPEGLVLVKWLYLERGRLPNSLPKRQIVLSNSLKIFAGNLPCFFAMALIGSYWSATCYTCTRLNE